MSSRSETKATTLESISTFRLEKKKKKPEKKVECTLLDFTHFATNSVNEDNRIESEGNRWQSATNLTESPSSTGCVSRADSWRKETGDEWRAATWGDIRTWRPSNTSPFSFSLSHSLGVDPRLLYVRLICKLNRRSLRENALAHLQTFQKYNICAHDT